MSRAFSRHAFWHSFKLIIPNLMTTVRLLLIIPYVLFMQQGMTTLAGFTYFIAFISDLDGAVARKLHATSAFGAIYDPFVDTTFLLTGFALLIQHDMITPLAVYMYFAAFIYKFIPQLLFLLRNRTVKSTYVSKTISAVGMSALLLATFGVAQIVTATILVLDSIACIILGTYWLSGAAPLRIRKRTS